MDLIVLNDKFEAISVIDAYESFIWTDRYCEPGDFEIYTPVSDQMLEFPVVDNYIRIDDSDYLMIIEDITIESDVEDGNHIKIVGRSLESILDRRVIINELNINGNLQNSIRDIISTNIINPTDPDRKIENFIFEDSTDSRITELTYEGQFKGDTLLDAIKEMCSSKDLGFRIILNDENQFVFSIYMGIDRSYRQEELPYVVFKPSLDNIINSEYTELHSSAKTFCYAHSSYSDHNSSYYTESGGDATFHSSSAAQIDVIRTVGSGKGLLRKETYKDAGVSKDDDMSMGEYYAKIDEAGNEELTDKKVKKTFEGELETTRLFVYNRDFFMGDVVQVANNYGKECPSRVTEFIRSQTRSEFKRYPTFTALDYEESEEST